MSRAEERIGSDDEMETCSPLEDLDPKVVEGFRMLLAMTLDQHQEYWDSVYEKELDSFQMVGRNIETCQDKEILYEWYGKDIHFYVLAMISHLNLDMSSPILDLGTGNGHLVHSLAVGFGFTNVTGLDYSQAAINLSKSVYQQHAKDADSSVVANFICRDFLQPVQDQLQYKLIIDKGLLDAVAMTRQSQDHSITIQEEENPNFFGPISRTYVKRLCEQLAPGGYYILCSCNHTQGEILALLGEPSDYFAQAPGLTLVHQDTQESGVLVFLFQRPS